MIINGRKREREREGEGGWEEEKGGRCSAPRSLDGVAVCFDAPTQRLFPISRCLFVCLFI